MPFSTGRIRSSLDSRLAHSVSGFTLVELMVVVAVIGILSVIGISKYNMYSIRSRSVEQKVMLSSIETTLQTFYAVEGTYTMCLKEAGFEVPSGVRRWYAVGFGSNAAGASGCGPSGNQVCNAYKFNSDGTIATDSSGHQLLCFASSIFSPANSQMDAPGGHPPGLAELNAIGTQVSQQSFTVGAVGFIGGDPL